MRDGKRVSNDEALVLNSSYGRGTDPERWRDWPQITPPCGRRAGMIGASSATSVLLSPSRGSDGNQPLPPLILFLRLSSAVEWGTSQDPRAALSGEPFIQ